MDATAYAALTDEALRIEKKKLKKRKLINALVIGFLASIVMVGVSAGSLGSEKNHIAFLLPLLFPIYFIYHIVKNSKKDKALETVLKERNL